MKWNCFWLFFSVLTRHSFSWSEFVEFLLWPPRWGWGTLSFCQDDRIVGGLDPRCRHGWLLQSPTKRKCVQNTDFIKHMCKIGYCQRPVATLHLIKRIHCNIQVTIMRIHLVRLFLCFSTMMRSLREHSGSPMGCRLVLRRDHAFVSRLWFKDDRLVLKGICFCVEKMFPISFKDGRLVHKGTYFCVEKMFLILSMDGKCAFAMRTCFESL